ncbi:MAG: T9SS type A sorting domain-containing protein [Chitinophagales bacterium]|nr:T9SS type A sorting domain-containing protein [Chitinophagales bacterium]
MKYFLFSLLLISANCAFSLDVTNVKVSRSNGQIFITWHGNTAKEYLIYRTTYKITDATGWPASKFGKSPPYSTKNVRLSDIVTDGPHYFKVPVDNQGSTVVLNPSAGYGGLFVLTCTDNSTTKYFYGVKMVGSSDAPTPGQNTTISGAKDVISTPKPIYQQSRDLDGLSGNDIDVYVHFATALVPSSSKKMMNSGFIDFIGFNFGVIPYIDLSSPAPHPAIVKFHAGGSDFLADGSGFVSDAPSAYKICIDDWLPNDQTTWFFGYNEDYDLTKPFVLGETLPPSCNSTCQLDDPSCHGINYDYTLQRILYTIEQVKALYNNAPNTNANDDINSNKISLIGRSLGGGGGMIATILAPKVFSAVRLIVPKMDFSFPNEETLPLCAWNFDIEAEADAYPCYIHELYYHTRAKSNTKWGTVSANWPSYMSDLNNGGGKYGTYDLLNAGFMISENTKANIDLPILFAFSGKNDGGQGWEEKLPVYDSMNDNRQPGYFFWDQGEHDNPDYWNFNESIPLSDITRYSSNQAYLAFSDCSSSDNPATDLQGTLNGFFDWDENSIVDDNSTFSVKLKWRTLIAKTGDIVTPNPPNMITNITLRRQEFPGNYTGRVCWTLFNLTKSTSVSGESIVANLNGPVYINKLHLSYPDEYRLAVERGACTGEGIEKAEPGSFVSVDNVSPNPFIREFSIKLSLDKTEPVSIRILDVYGKEEVDQSIRIPTTSAGEYFITVNGEHWNAGIYFLEIIAGKERIIKKLVKAD